MKTARKVRTGRRDRRRRHIASATAATMIKSTVHPSRPAREATTILIVDDDRENLRALALMIDTMGYRSRSFDDARTALAEIKNGLRPALVISDYRMPGMDGLQFVEALRADGNTAPVILLTAHGNIDTYFRSFSLGVFDFVNKPVRDVELKRIIMTALEGRGTTVARPR
jgi:FixJ family two-component response regulator